MSSDPASVAPPGAAPSPDPADTPPSSRPGLRGARLPPELTPHERAARMLAWTRSQEGLKRFLHLLPEGATLADALSLHRALRQVGRQPSKVMQEPAP